MSTAAASAQKEIARLLDERPELAELVEHVDIGIVWRQLGIQLRLERRELDSIDQQYPFLPDKLLYMFQLWLDSNPTANRSDVLEALRKIGEDTIASNYESWINELAGHQEEPRAMDGTRPKSFDVLLQSIGVQPSLVTSDDRIIEVDTFNCNSFKDIVTNPNNTVKVRPVLISFGGLPESEKTNAFTNLKEHVISNPLIPVAMKNRPMAAYDISHYDLIAAAGDPSSGNLLITEATKESSCVFGILSAFKQNLLHRGRVPLLDPREMLQSFKNPALNEHLQYMYQYLSESLPTGSLVNDEVIEYANKLKILFPYEIALINVWDIPTNKTVHDVLSALQGHLTNNHMWLFLNLERDFRHLHEPRKIFANRDSAVLMKWRPRLHYLLHSCRLSDSRVKRRRNVCTIFARHSVSSDRELQQRLDELEGIVESAAEHIGVSNLLNDRIEPMSRQNNATSQRLIHDIISRTEVQNVPIAWVFLRSFFHCSSMRFISRDELKALAGECGMDDNSLANFCKFYTSFGSIFDLSLVNPNCQYIITKPIHFLRSLDSFLHPPNEVLQRYPTITYGIFPKTAGIEILKEDWPAYIDALACLNLATAVATDHIQMPPDVSLDPNDMYYYIPSSCTGPLVEDIDLNSIHLITSINTPDVFHQAMFARHLLSSLPQPELVPCINSNQTIIRDTSTDTTVTLVSYGPATKLHLDKPNSEVCSAVVQAYDVMARRSPVTVKYKFVKMCVSGMIPGARYLPSALYHVLPGDSLCEKCEDAGILDDEILKVWNSVLKQHPINDMYQPTEELSDQEVSEIAHMIASYDESIDFAVIAKTFGFPNYKSEKLFTGLTGHHLVAEFIRQWNEKKKMQKGSQEPRRALASRLSNLGCDLSLIQDEPKMIRGFFEKVASEVDPYYIPQESIVGVKHKRIGQRHLQRAIREGSVKSRITKAVIQGEARAGKTSLKCLLLSQPYDKLSTSTGCIEAPQVAFSVNRYGSTGKCWKLVDDDKMADKVLAKLKLISEGKKDDEFKATMSSDKVNIQHSNSSEAVSITAVASDKKDESTNSVAMPTSNDITTPQISSSEDDNAAVQSDAAVISGQKQVYQKEAFAKVKELYQQCRNLVQNEELSFHQEWLYFIDSGGQIQFQKLLPAFMPFASVLILVINLAKGLSDPASTVMQLEHDQQIDVSKHSPTVEEILKQLLSAIASSTEQFDLLIVKDPILSQHIKPPSKKLNVISVATHRDEYNQLVKDGVSVESLKTKEAKLQQIFDLIKQKCTIKRDEPPQCKILHEVDGSKAERSEFNDPVVEQIAEMLKEQAYKVKVPIRWYCFNVLLRTIAKEGCGVLSVSYCQALGEQLEMSEGEVESALKFLHLLNMLLYYPDSPAADMVFVHLDSLVNIIKDLVVIVNCNRDNWEAAEDNFKKLVTKGFLSVKVLEKSKHFHKILSFFSDFGKKLLDLFQKLLIASHLPTKDAYFMPALLPIKDVSNLSLFPNRTPLLFFFRNALPMGLFCAFIVCLLSDSSDYTSDYESSNSSKEDDEEAFTSSSSSKQWRIVQTESLNWSNYFTLQYNDMEGTFVFVERLDCIEVHAEHPNVQIRKLIRKAIKATIEERQLKERVEKAFYCNCPVGKGARHVAVLRRVDKKYALRCSNSGVNDYNLDKEKCLWLKTNPGEPASVHLSTDHKPRRKIEGTAGADTISAVAPLPTGDQQQPLKLAPRVATEIFKKHLPELSKSMTVATNRLSIAIKLYSEGFITWDAYHSVIDGPKTDQEKGISLTNTLMTSISSQPELLIKLVDVLKQEEPFQLIAEQLSDKIKRATSTTSKSALLTGTGGERGVDTPTQSQPVPVSTSIAPQALSDNDLRTCSRHLVNNLEEVAGFLELSDECFDSIQAQNRNKAVQGYKVLKKWQEDHPESTRQHLIDVFKSLELTKAVESLSTTTK